jgi:hypothetical protein
MPAKRHRALSGAFHPFIAWNLKVAFGSEAEIQTDPLSPVALSARLRAPHPTGPPSRLAAICGKQFLQLIFDNQNPYYDPLCHEKHDRQHMQASGGERRRAPVPRISGRIPLLRGEEASKEIPSLRGQRNQLKSLAYDKEIQENPKAFLWLFMVELAWNNAGAPKPKGLMRWDTADKPPAMAAEVNPP